MRDRATIPRPLARRRGVLSAAALLGLLAASPAARAGVTGHWLFTPEHVRGRTADDLTGRHPGTIEGTFQIAPDPGALVLDGSTTHVTLGGSVDPASLPPSALTAEAWVALESGTRWGGIFGYIQDNGSFEKGWLLGYDSTNFTMALATSGSLTYLTGTSAFEPGQWYHVAGTYDGRELRLYVNGRLEATTASRQGDIDYAPATFAIGCYLDDNEFFPLHGRLHEVKLHDQALSAEEVRARYDEKSSLFPRLGPLYLGPSLTFTARDAATVRWETSIDTPSILRYGTTRELTERIADSLPKRAHQVTLAGLEPETVYYYAVIQERGGTEVSTPVYEFSTEFNYKPFDISGIASPYPEDELTALCEAAAGEILAAAGITRGYCLDYDSGDGRLAFAIARRSELQVVAVTDDAAQADRARQLLKQAGAYGSRVAVHVRPLAALPYAPGCFNLVVSGGLVATGRVRGSAAELRRVLRPEGGTACLGQPAGTGSPLDPRALEEWLSAGGLASEVTSGASGTWAVARRPPLAGAGAWTHMYGDPGQTAASGDTLVRGENLRLQWFGRPGPRGMIDRQSRNPTPLTAAGRLFVQGDNRITTMDAYNGAVLWTLELPDLRRVNIPRDTANWCTDGESLYVALRDACWRLEAATGELLQVYEAVPPESAGSWGYVAILGERLLGSRVKPASHYTEFKGPEKWYDATSGGFGTQQVTSEELFALDRDSGARLWSRGGAVILNSSIAAAPDRIFFVESRNPEALASETGRMGSSSLFEDQYLVALEAATGATVWEVPVSFPRVPLPLAFYLTCAEERLVAVASTNRYHLYCYSAADGTLLWSREHAWNRSHHGGHMYHPVIMEGTVFVEPRGYDLATGTATAALPARGGCSTLSGAATTLHFVDWDYHNGSFYFWDLDTGQRARRAGSRASCWLAIVSGGGMVLVPTASSGCTCRYPLQTSLGYRSW